MDIHALIEAKNRNYVNPLWLYVMPEPTPIRLGSPRTYQHTEKRGYNSDPGELLLSDQGFAHVPTLPEPLRSSGVTAPGF